MSNLFGTGGIRGVENNFPIDNLSSEVLGEVLADLSKKNNWEKICIAQDTRSSGILLFENFYKGLSTNESLEIYKMGILTTHSAVLYSKKISANICVIITASHNNFSENGFKFFNFEGRLVDKKLEEEIEKDFFDKKIEFNNSKKHFHLKNKEINIEAREHYLNFLRDNIEEKFSKKIVIDCANGAASVFKDNFQEIFNEAKVVNSSPNGRNINLNCGSTHTEFLCEIVKKNKFDFGISLDGDGDRLALVDENGEVIHSDKLMAFLAIEMNKKNKDCRKLVVTEYSSLALDDFLKPYDISVERTENGERNVVDKMFEKNALIGGEYSGHIIIKNFSTSGDGLFVAIKALNFLEREKKKTSYITNLFDLYPSFSKNISVQKKKTLAEMKKLQEAILKAKTKMQEEGKIIVRHSGTENVCRVFVEGKKENQIKEIGKEISDIIESESNIL